MNFMSALIDKTNNIVFCASRSQGGLIYISSEATNDSWDQQLTSPKSNERQAKPTV